MGGQTGAAAELDLVTQACHGTVLDRPVRLVRFEHAGGERCFVQLAGCCLAYRRLYSGTTGWDGYCTTCPRVPVDATIDRIRALLDR
ncbi:MAG: hypothetical protein AAF547_14815 [Actinomycetota bacterium]